MGKGNKSKEGLIVQTNIKLKFGQYDLNWITTVMWLRECMDLLTTSNPYPKITTHAILSPLSWDSLRFSKETKSTIYV